MKKKLVKKSENIQPVTADKIDEIVNKRNVTNYPPRLEQHIWEKEHIRRK